MGFDSFHTNFHSVQKVVSARLKQYGQGHAAGHMRKRLQNLSMYSRMDSPPF